MNSISGSESSRIFKQKQRFSSEFRIQKLETDEHFGDCKNVGDGIRELRINYAKGYRVYFKKKENKIIVLLIGGEKSSQQKEIKKARDIWNKIKNN